MKIKRKKSIKEAVKILKDYMNTYENQIGYADYQEKVFIDDIIYGLGISLNDNYQFSDGFMRFKKDLLEYLKNNT